MFVYWTYWLCVKAKVAPDRDPSRAPIQPRIERFEPRPTRPRALVAARSSSTARA